MAKIINKTTRLCTVGEVINALKRFPDNMPISSGLSDTVKVYQLEPELEENYPDKRGEVVIEGE